MLVRQHRIGDAVFVGGPQPFAYDSAAGLPQGVRQLVVGQLLRAWSGAMRKELEDGHGGILPRASDRWGPSEFEPMRRLGNRIIALPRLVTRSTPPALGVGE